MNLRVSAPSSEATNFYLPSKQIAFSFLTMLVLANLPKTIPGTLDAENREIASDYKRLASRVSACASFETTKQNITGAVKAAMEEVPAAARQDEDYEQLQEEISGLVEEEYRCTTHCQEGLPIRYCNTYADNCADCCDTRDPRLEKELAFLSRAPKTSKVFAEHLKILKQIGKKYAQFQCRRIRNLARTPRPRP